MQYKVRVGARETWIPALPESLKHEFSAEELEQMLEQFCDFDESGDGSIAASELIVLMRSMGILTSLEDVQALIDKVDDNRSGELEFHEFVRLVSEFRRGNSDKLAEFIQYSKLALAIRRELLDLTENPTDLSTPRPVKGSAWEWLVDVQGPPTTPYEGGVFVLKVTFSHDYPYEAPVLTCLTRIYHPNFVPLLNGSMTLYGFMENWEPEWRMRGLLERVEQLMATPNIDSMTAFYDETTSMLARTHETPSNGSHSPKRHMRHPREITLECIDAYITDAETFFAIAKQFTEKNAKRDRE